MPYHLTPMTERYLPQAAALERRCFPDPWSEALLRDAMECGTVLFLAAVDPEDRVLGYAILSVVLDEGNLDNIAVAPEHRREGIAEALLGAFLAFGRERLAFLTLEVRASNALAIGLYKKFGFLTVGRRRNYYEAPREDALLMTLDFRRQ